MQGNVRADWRTWQMWDRDNNKERTCHKCGKAGHASATCTAEGVEQRECYKCGGKGHLAALCTVVVAVAGNLKCYNCGDIGHRASVCPKEKMGKACYNCGEEGHALRNCPQPVPKRAKASTDVPGQPNSNKGDKEAGNNQVQWDYTANNAAGDCGSKRSCFHCGERGHMSKDCAAAGGAKICFAFKKGKCTREGCTFSHSITPAALPS